MINRIKNVDPAPPWTAFGALLTVIGMFACMVVGTVIGDVIFTDSWLALLTGWSIGAVFAMILVSLTRRRNSAENHALKLDDATTTPLPIVLLFSLGMAVLIDLILLAVTGDFFPTAELFPYFAQLLSGESIVPLDIDFFAWIMAALFLVVLQPIAEELVFRGVAYPAFRAMYGAWFGLGAIIIIHALFHLITYAPDPPNIWYGFVAPLMAGAVITLTRAYTGSTRAAIVAHVAFGIFAVLKAFAIAG